MRGQTVVTIAMLSAVAACSSRGAGFGNACESGRVPARPHL